MGVELSTSEITAHQAYPARLEERRADVVELQRQRDRLGWMRLLTFAIGIGFLFFAFQIQMFSPWFLIAPAVAFFLVLLRYDATVQRWHRAKRAVKFYEQGVERLAGRWVGNGTTGERFLERPHLASLDLDVFGKGSLFERICTVRTRPGEETLAAWFLEPSPADEVKSRQEAVSDLAPRLDLRERLAMLGAELPPIDLDAVAKWGSSPVTLYLPQMQRLLVGLASANVLTLAFWLIVGGSPFPFLVSIVISAFVAMRFVRDVGPILKPVEPMGHDLSLLVGLLREFESAPFNSSQLNTLQAELRADGLSPSQQISQLVRLVDWLNARRNQMFAPIAVLLMWRTQMALAFEAWRARSGPLIANWLRAIGSIEALSSIAAYAFENPDDPFPELIDGPALFDGDELGHPLLQSNVAVRNDVKLIAPIQLLLVSGSNMSGKSTLLRSVGTNAVLAMAGAPVRAKRLRLSPMRLGATLRVQDSLLAGKSRFFAEITRVREILDAARGPLPLMFLLDEIFHGTNSHDRVLGAEAVIRNLLDAGAIGLVTTHDLSLTEAGTRLGERAKNVHFADQFRDGEMVFDYRMRPGVVPHSNALALMRAIGLEV